MWKYFYLLIPSILVFNYSLAHSSDLVIIAGYANEKRYANLSKLWFQSFSKQGDVKIFAKIANKNTEEGYTTTELKSMWQFTSQSNIIDLNNFSVLKTHLNSANPSGLTNKRKPPITIFINDHGEPPRKYGEKYLKYLFKDTNGRLKERSLKEFEYEDRSIGTKEVIGDATDHAYVPASSSIKMERGDFSHEEFGELLQEKYSANKFVRIVGVHCYSGGIHEISFVNKQTCSLASTDWVSKSSSTEEINLYGKGIVAEKDLLSENKKFDLDKNGNTSLTEAHFSGLSYDNFNFGRNSLSSMAYIDKILEQGAYQRKLENDNYDPYQNNLTPSLICPYQTPGKYASTLQNFISLIDPFTDWRGFARNQRNILLLKHDAIKLTAAEIKILPMPLKNIYFALLKNKTLIDIFVDFKEKTPKLIKSLADLKYARDNLLKQKVKVSQKKINNLNNDIREELRLLKTQQAKWRGFFKYFKYLKDITKFLSQATRIQKETFSNMIACEMATL